ncbi:MAG: band 7 protein [Candidatus Magasanikbacteria bacterium CG_4_9_14_0_2_um_filter_42_11]|uniref:Band 7 protein n=1 Tax=Candidatus Magasanikbacteria bacterium CG_4_9_14_0_2_um_filter_42_11 TaxID=1974643 RepID=A0A2M8F9N6_9BACT|nr:MAG: band 7 protein [Candidatus Magasanikbacteria bacterium CG10_big_fil_rev_8_21_14_0_10_43_9]PIY92859.1 MAG: band 7 protein [Candidatus Magasanikbacteria bacterium CG_4_10_14_0_8_um_filter_42_12]PJC52450.1 MAG: band 7 protein [Candidatus Magasanikbacteria bacterium CG_4_9_14_0_2_um_filter_42_11]
MQTLDPTHLRRYIKSGGALFLVFLVALVFAISCWTIVSAGHTGVQTLFGKVKDEELSSGFHIKNPLVHITELSVRTEDYTMSVTQGEGEKTGPDAISALTKEGLNVVLDITVLYHLQEDKASDMYRDVGLDYDNVVIRPLTRSTIREVVAQYDVKDIYSEKRGEASQQILEVLQSKLNPRGIEVEDVLLRNVLLPENLASSIEAKLQAEQESQRYEFVLEKEKKEAERKRLEAEGQRDAQQIINQSLTTRYLEYLYIESLKDREGTIYVPTNPSNGIPLLRGL